jgi:hypothetical protein
MGPRAAPNPALLRRAWLQAAGGAALATLLPPARAEARALAAEEVRRLDAGEIVRHPVDVELARGDYFGGVAYAIVPAPLGRVMEVLLDAGSYRSILPLCQEARVISASGLDRQIAFRTGGRAGSVAYVLFVRRESQGLVRFWLDPSQPHDIADCWGYFRAQSWTKETSLLTYAALLHLDFGIIKMLFTETIRRYALNTPALVRSYVQAHPTAG